MGHNNYPEIEARPPSDERQWLYIITVCYTAGSFRGHSGDLETEISS